MPTAPNGDVSSAVSAGIKLLAGRRRSSLFIEEGQSNTAQGWEVVGVDQGAVALLQFPAEHRADMFGYCPDLSPYVGQLLRNAEWGRSDRQWFAGSQGHTLGGFPEECVGHHLVVVPKGTSTDADPSVEVISLTDEWDIAILPSGQEFVWGLSNERLEELGEEIVWPAGVIRPYKASDILARRRLEAAMIDAANGPGEWVQTAEGEWEKELPAETVEELEALGVKE